MYFYGLSASDVQGQLPIIHPVVDYKNKLAQPLFGGELTYRANLTSLSRDNADFDPITQTAFNTGQCDSVTADPAVKTPDRLHPARHAGHLLARLRGGHLAAHADRSVRAEVDAVRRPRASTSRRCRSARRPASRNFLPTGDSTVGRFMPAVGLEYRYPFISVQPWGTQTIEPIAQLIVRPNETADRQAAERGRAKPDLRRQQPVQRQQVLRLGPHRGRHAAQCRRAIHRAVQSRRLRQRAVRAVLSAVRAELLRGPGLGQYRPDQRA